MPAFVLDASVALGWLLDDPPSEYAMRVQLHMQAGAQACVPPHWHMEIANALIHAPHRALFKKDLAAILRLVTELVPFLVTDAYPETVAELVAFGQRYALTAYDAAYVGLAISHGMPIATLDRAMLRAAKSLGLQVLD